MLSPDLLQLGRWAVRYYHHPPGEVFAALLPVLLRKGVAATGAATRRYTITHSGSKALRDGKLRQGAEAGSPALHAAVRAGRTQRVRPGGKLHRLASHRPGPGGKGLDPGDLRTGMSRTRAGRVRSCSGPHRGAADRRGRHPRCGQHIQRDTARGRHGQWQDGSLPGGRCGHVGSGSPGSYPGAGDRPYTATGGHLSPTNPPSPVRAAFEPQRPPETECLGGGPGG